VFAYCNTKNDLETEAGRVHRECSGGPITMALAAMGPEIAGEERAPAEWRTARDLGLPVTVHMGGHGAESAARGLAFLEENSLIGHPTTYVHANHYTDDDFKRIAANNGTVSVSPAVEVALDIGRPPTGRARKAGAPTGLSADTVTSGPGDMFSLMRAAYVLERATDLDFTTADALRTATIEGAEVAGLAAETGSAPDTTRPPRIMRREKPTAHGMLSAWIPKSRSASPTNC
jgi:cytosine/adenosine deaminase-related metal-dependent hydrolase